MGDPLTLATGIAGLITLGLEVTSITQKWICGVRNAAKDVNEFLIELAALIEVLGRLNELLKNDTNGKPNFDRTSVLFMTYSACEDKLRAVRLKLLKRGKHHKFFNALMWPFVKEEHRQTVVALHQWVQIFQFALTVDGCELLSKAAGDVGSILVSQLQTLEETRKISRAVPALQQGTEEASIWIKQILEAVGMFPATTGDIFNIKENVATLKRLALDDQLQKTRSARSLGKEKLLEWVSPFDLRAKQTDILSRRSPSTGEWLIDNVDFDNWVDGIGPTCLWCSGIPGAGKTVLTSIVVDHLQSKSPGSHTAVAYVYFDYKNKDTQNVSAVFHILLRQLLEQAGTIPQEIQGCYDSLSSKRKENEMGVDQCLSYMQAVGQKFDRVFMVFDALDDCPEYGDKTNELRSKMLFTILKASRFATIFITSRPNVNVTEAIGDCARLEIKACDSDVAAYLQARAEDHKILRKMIVDNPALEIDLVATICTKASGMFLLARLQMDALVNQTSVRNVYRALERLPEKLKDTFDDAMIRRTAQPKEYATLAAQVISWIFYAKRPLSVAELCEALSVEPGGTRLDRSGCPEVELLLDVCCGLVSIDEQDNVIRLVHYSLQQYLEEHWKTDFPRANRDITATCLTYLMLEDFSPEAMEIIDVPINQARKKPVSSSTRSQWQQSHRFFSYVASYWGDHVRGSLEKELETLILRFFDQKMHLLYCLQENNKILFRNLEYDTWPHEPSSLHLTAYWGLPYITEKLIKQGADIHAEDYKKRTPLVCAALNGHGDVAYILLDNGADINTRDVSAATPLHAAVVNDHVDVARLLLLRWTDVNAQDKDGSSPMCIAASNGNLPMMDLLLRNGASAAKLRRRGPSPLEIASRGGHASAVQWLLMKGVEITKNGFPVIEAVYANHPHIVRILLNAMAHVNVVNEHGDTALGAAVKQGNLNIVERLVTAGADASAGGASVESESPLQLASYRGDKGLVNYLMNQGAGAHAHGGDVGTVLQNAIYSQDLGIVKRVLERLKPSDVTVGKGSFGSTPLQLAVLLNDKDILTQLLQHESNSKHYGDVVDPNTPTPFGITPLHQAVYLGWQPGIKALVQAGANPRLSDLYGRTCLDYALADRAMFGKLGGQKSDKPTSSAARKQKLRQSVRDLVNTLLQDPDRKDGRRINYHYLGHCLLKLADVEEARTSFEQQIKNVFSKHQPAHNIQCHNCGGEDIKGGRFVCHVCPDIDLCLTHTDEYGTNPPDPRCKGHHFLEVPGPDWKYFGNGKVNRQTETINEWLTRLLLKYWSTG